jgi:hypothetical protein
VCALGDDPAPPDAGSTFVELTAASAAGKSTHAPQVARHFRNPRVTRRPHDLEVNIFPCNSASTPGLAELSVSVDKIFVTHP